MGSEVLAVRMHREAELSTSPGQHLGILQWGILKTLFPKESDLRLCQSAVLLTSLRGQILSMWQERKGLLFTEWCLMTLGSQVSEFLVIFGGSLKLISVWTNFAMFWINTSQRLIHERLGSQVENLF